MAEEKEKLTDLFEKFLVLSLGAASATKEKLEQVVSDLVGKGDLSEDEGKKILGEVFERSKEEAQSIHDAVKEEVQKAFAAMGFATKEDIKHLEVEIEKLRDKINDLMT